MLADQASLAYPQLTAANVFVVNITTLFDLLATFVSYIIVFIPFIK